jgi:putative hydrolase
MHPLLRPAEDLLSVGVPRVDGHLHTSWTDGESSVEVMHRAGEDAGLLGVLFSEHARHTSGDWFPAFAAEVRALNAVRCQAYVGVEVKIRDFDGSLDISESIAGTSDLIMASVHRFPGEEGIATGTAAYSANDAVDLEWRLASAALDNPTVDILGHPFGMCYRRFKIHPPDDRIKDLIVRAARTGVAFEVNARYHPDPWQLIRWSAEVGGVIALGSNAHNRQAVGHIVRILEGEEQPWRPFES